MDTQISRVLAQGMADGDNPRLLARKLIATINGTGMGELAITDTLGRFIPAARRAEMLARTEIIRAHHNATIQEYRNWAVEGVKVKAEFVTAGDDRVCDRCAALEREVFTLDRIEGMIPLHPNCRCCAIPFKGEPGVKEAWMEDDVAMNMKDSANGEKYYKYKQEYKGKLEKYSNFYGKNDLTDQAKAISEWEVGKDRVYLSDHFIHFINKDEVLSKMKQIARTWQSSTSEMEPMALKIWGSRLEKTNKVLFRTFDEAGIKALKEAVSTFMSADDYLRIRAFNQAYMDMIGQKSVTLYRGTDGGKGKAIRDALNRGAKRNRWNMNDSSLAGYSDSLHEADKFGMLEKGVTIRIKIKGSDIIIHRDFLSPLTEKMYREREWIVKGIEKYVNLKDIQYLDINGIAKLFGP